MARCDRAVGTRECDARDAGGRRKLAGGSVGRSPGIIPGSAACYGNNGTIRSFSLDISGRSSWRRGRGWRHGNNVNGDRVAGTLRSICAVESKGNRAANIRIPRMIRGNRTVGAAKRHSRGSGRGRHLASCSIRRSPGKRKRISIHHIYWSIRTFGLDIHNRCGKNFVERDASKKYSKRKIYCACLHEFFMGFIGKSGFHQYSVGQYAPNYLHGSICQALNLIKDIYHYFVLYV